MLVCILVIMGKEIHSFFPVKALYSLTLSNTLEIIGFPVSALLITAVVFGVLVSKRNSELCLDNEDHSVFCSSGNNTSGNNTSGNNTDYPKWVYIVRGVALLISVPFLLATALVFVLVQHQKPHDKALICHMTSLSVAYFSLGLTQVASESFSHSWCVGLAFIVQFTLLTSFFWLNVMCFDIWWTFRSSVKANPFKFVTYSLYAWGCPLCILGATLFVDFHPGVLTGAIRPGMGEVTCFFKDTDALTVYLYLPIGVIVYLNVAMFLATSLRLRAHSKSTKVLHNMESSQHSKDVVWNKANVQRYGLYLKLSFVMGINWLLEILSFFLGGSLILWLITDVANALQGVTVFLLLVCRQHILRLLQQRCYPASWLFRDQEQSTKTSSSRFIVKSPISVVRNEEQSF